jgi:hypothetical protein
MSSKLNLSGMTPEQAGFIASLDAEKIACLDALTERDRGGFLRMVRLRGDGPEDLRELAALLERPGWLDALPADLRGEYGRASLLDRGVLKAVADATGADPDELEERLRWIAGRRIAAEPDPDSPGLTRGQAEFLRSLDADSRSRLDSLPPRERRRIVDDFTHGHDPELDLREDAIRRIRRMSSSVRLPKPPRGRKARRP